MAADRSRRVNAGKNISKLLQSEEKLDEFYSTAYGGFEEVSGDEFYKSEEEEEDLVDSDFDRPEDEDSEGESGDEVDEPKRKKKKLSEITAKSIAREKAARKEVGDKKERVPRAGKPKAPSYSTQEGEERTLRKSTVEFTEERKRQRRLQAKKKNVPRKKTTDRVFTQAELLEEAKLTEIENLRSLEAFVRLEEEKKKTTSRRKVVSGPTVRYLSMTMPLVSEKDGSEIVDTSLSNAIDISNDPPKIGSNLHYSRNFVEFSDATTIEEIFPRKVSPRIPRRHFCPITGQVAKYFDPVTQTPYATVEAFKALRGRYVDTEQQKCEERILQLHEWLEEKRKQISQS